MEITERQIKILNRIVQEYIASARPVSSTQLQEKYDFGICPATIRIEMQKLTDKGYLYQPHTSAGRAPTDQGYRFFVDRLIEKGVSSFDRINDWFQEEIGVTKEIKFLQRLTKNLAHLSHVFVLSYFEKEKIFWKEGWEEILKTPEFTQLECIINFMEFLENFEKNIENLKINSGIKVLIGKENPFKKANDFSIISSRCCLLDGSQTIISLLGPKRMNYSRNIRLINSLTKLNRANVHNK